jgi:hypothetical protein
MLTDWPSAIPHNRGIRTPFPSNLGAYADFVDFVFDEVSHSE